MWLILIISGGLHGLILLPVMLSYFGDQGFELDDDQDLGNLVQARYEVEQQQRRLVRDLLEIGHEPAPICEPRKGVGRRLDLAAHDHREVFAEDRRHPPEHGEQTGCGKHEREDVDPREMVVHEHGHRERPERDGKDEDDPGGCRSSLDRDARRLLPAGEGHQRRRPEPATDRRRPASRGAAGGGGDRGNAGPRDRGFLARKARQRLTRPPRWGRLGRADSRGRSSS